LLVVAENNIPIAPSSYQVPHLLERIFRKTKVTETMFDCEILIEKSVVIFNEVNPRPQDISQKFFR
jgi:formate-dependent phosphoribosylglycinamide formyltransferase (GAR transformylase)